jgi:hypothetical protein
VVIDGPAFFQLLGPLLQDFLFLYLNWQYTELFVHSTKAQSVSMSLALPWWEQKAADSKIRMARRG